MATKYSSCVFHPFYYSLLAAKFLYFAFRGAIGLVLGNQSSLPESQDRFLFCWKGKAALNEGTNPLIESPPENGKNKPDPEEGSSSEENIEAKKPCTEREQKTCCTQDSAQHEERPVPVFEFHVSIRFHLHGLQAASRLWNLLPELVFPPCRMGRKHPRVCSPPISSPS